MLTPNRVTACLASQYAGWKLSHGTGEDAFFALGSGPARALARKEPLFSEIAYRDEAGTAAVVLERRRPAAGRDREQGRAGLRAGARPPELPLCSHSESRRRCASGGAGPGRRPAQDPR